MPDRGPPCPRRRPREASSLRWAVSFSSSDCVASSVGAASTRKLGHVRASKCSSCLPVESQTCRYARNPSAHVNRIERTTLAKCPRASDGMHEEKRWSTHAAAQNRSESAALTSLQDSSGEAGATRSTILWRRGFSPKI